MVTQMINTGVQVLELIWIMTSSIFSLIVVEIVSESHRMRLESMGNFSKSVDINAIFEYFDA
jgi:hypothetical protein